MVGDNNDFECPVCGDKLNRNSEMSYWHLKSHEMEKQLDEPKRIGKKVYGADEKIPKRR